LERFTFVWKNWLFRWEIKWNGPFHWKFFGKKECLKRDFPFLGCAGIIGISQYDLRHHTNMLLLDELRGLFVEKLYIFIWLKILTGKL